MHDSQLRKSVLPLSVLPLSVLPLSALVAAGALALTTSAAAIAAEPVASATDPALPGGEASLSESPVTGEVGAFAQSTDTASSRQYSSATVVVTRTLTSKVRASAKATYRASRGASASASAKVVRYAPTHAAALAEAQQVADVAAHDRATKAAVRRAAKIASTRAKAMATSQARAGATKAVRIRFGKVVVERAAKQRGKPYRWGAAGPGSFDCSGLVRYVMKGAGVNGLPRTSGGLAASLDRIATSQKKPGDLIFFRSAGRVSHVGIYAGNGQIWHSPGAGRSVRKADIWSSSYSVGRPV